MTREEIIKDLNNIFIDVMEDEDIKISGDTTSNDVDDWDSLNHIHLVVSIEKHFKIRFTSHEIESWKNVTEMIVDIQKRQNNA